MEAAVVWKAAMTSRLPTRVGNAARFQQLPQFLLLEKIGEENRRDAEVHFAELAYTTQQSARSTARSAQMPHVTPSSAASIVSWDGSVCQKVELTRFRGHLKIRRTTMPNTHKPYPEEFKKKMVALVRQGRSPEELGKQFEPSGQAIRNWVAQADRDEGRE